MKNIFISSGLLPFSVGILKPVEPRRDYYTLLDEENKTSSSSSRRSRRKLAFFFDHFLFRLLMFIYRSCYKEQKNSPDLERIGIEVGEEDQARSDLHTKICDTLSQKRKVDRDDPLLIFRRKEGISSLEKKELMASSSNSPCAACKFLRRKCTQECTFAPYFPPDQPLKFSNVHKVFGASNVAKLLNELAPSQREDAVNSLAYEANARLHDPVYGCVGVISVLQQQLKQVQNDLLSAKKELSAYIGPSAMLPLTHQHPHHHHHLLQQNPGLIATAMGPFGMSSLGAPHHQSQLLLREHQQHQQMLEAQQLAVVVAAREQQDMLRSYEQQQQQQQQELVRFNSGFDGVGSEGGPFNQMSSDTPSPLALVPFDNPFQVPQPHQDQHHNHHHQPQQQLQLQQQQQQQQQQQHQQQQQEERAGSDEESKDNITAFHVVGTSS